MSYAISKKFQNHFGFCFRLLNKIAFKLQEYLKQVTDFVKNRSYVTKIQNICSRIQEYLAFLQSIKIFFYIPEQQLARSVSRIVTPTVIITNHRPSCYPEHISLGIAENEKFQHMQFIYLQMLNTSVRAKMLAGPLSPYYVCGS
jgi:hypothetical protein